MISKDAQTALEAIGGERLEGSGFEDEPFAMTDDEMLEEMCQPVWLNLTKMIESGEVNIREKVAEFRKRPNLTRMQTAVLSALSKQYGDLS